MTRSPLQMQRVHCSSCNATIALYRVHKQINSQMQQHMSECTHVPWTMDMLTPIFQIILKKPHRRTSSGGFHWTKDGTKIAFISTNWSQVDEFTASKYHVYPYGEKLRQTPQMYKHFYPMPGRPAPKLKLNLVQLPQGSLAHIKPPKELDGQVK